MSRQLRIEYPGALWHVTSRGNERHNIFRDDVDRRLFLRLLAEAVDRFDWILPAYVLMSNHFHLMIQLTAETLSKGMQWLNGEYARNFNRRHRRVGHLLQGRPWCVLVEEEAYFLVLVRYIVLNPVRAFMVGKPEDHVWSSHRALLGETPVPDWLAADDVLMHFGETREAARPRYRQYVNEGIGQTESPWDHLAGQMFLGREAWIDDVRARIALKPRSDDHPRLQREVRAVPMADVIAAVARAWATDPDLVRHERGGIPRMVAAWVGCHEALLTNREIAAGLRLRSSTRVTQLVRECDRALSTNARVREAVDRSITTLRRETANCSSDP